MYTSMHHNAKLHTTTLAIVSTFPVRQNFCQPPAADAIIESSPNQTPITSNGATGTKYRGLGTLHRKIIAPQYSATPVQIHSPRLAPIHAVTANRPIKIHPNKSLPRPITPLAVTPR